MRTLGQTGDSGRLVVKTAAATLVLPRILVDSRGDGGEEQEEAGGTGGDGYRRPAGHRGEPEAE
jgi:hypothetical protein